MEIIRVTLTIPFPSPLQAGESFIVVSVSNVTDNYVVTVDAGELLLANGENVLFTTTVSPDEENYNVSVSISTAIVSGEEGQPNKTALRYLMDNVGGGGGGGSSAIFPNGFDIVTESRMLTSDDIGKLLVIQPAEGETSISLGTPNVSPFLPVGQIGVFNMSTEIDVTVPSDGREVVLAPSEIVILSSLNNTEAATLLLTGYTFHDGYRKTFNKYLVDIGKKVENNSSYSYVETATGGTWVDGKPIYRKTKKLIISDLQFVPGYGIAEHDVSTHIADIENVLDFKIFCDFTYSDGLKLTGKRHYNRFECFFAETSLTIYPLEGTSYDMSGWVFSGNEGIYLTLEYTKTTDTVE